jgi:catechol 2,3-dioxygenase-like lactoylglutathione lyase family enzyme
MRDEMGGPPKSGWASMVCELCVNELEASLAFWCGMLGFEIAYQRRVERFVYLEHPDGPQVMLCQRNGRFETGRLDYPLGQGAMLQVYIQKLDPVLDALAVRGWPIYLGPRIVWRQVGSLESGQREIFVQDPDGYLIMVAEGVGKRPLPAP